MDSEFVEDVRRIPRRAVSVSSCESDPLEFRHRTGAGSSRSSACGSDSDDDGDAFETRSNASSMGGDSVLSGMSSGSRGGDQPSRRRYHAVDALDVNDVAKDVEGSKQAVAVGDHSAAPTDGALQQPLDVPPALPVPLDLVSEAAVATVESIITSSSTVVAAKRGEALVLDAGTRMCLADGTVVGVVATVLGPVMRCSYAIVCKPATLAELALDDRVKEDVQLHYDLSRQFVLYDPSVQCDTARGTDASFLQDEELPPNARPDFSDDEEERHWKKRKRTAAAVATAAVPAASAAGGSGTASASPGQVVAAAPVGSPTSVVAAMAVVEDLSSDESEVEFDEEGNMVAYKPRQRRRPPPPASRGGRGGATRPTGDRPPYH